MPMPNEFWLYGQFQTALLSAEQVAQLFHVTAKTIRNRAAAGTFPRPRKDGLWHIEDVAAYLDCTTSAPSRLKVA